MKNKDIEKTHWIYNNVQWYPLDKHDPSLEWTDNTLKYYIEAKQKSSTVFIDLPGGYMDEYSRYTLNYIDELWVIMDNDILRMIPILVEDL